jgi:hypothetical protein
VTAEAAEAGVNSGAQVLVLGDAPEQREQLGALVGVERGRDRDFVLARDASKLGEQPAAVVGQRDRVVAAVAGIAVACDKPSVFELIDQRDQPRGVHPQGVSELALALARGLGQAAENPGLWRGEPERSDALGECAGGVGAELGQKECDTTIPRTVSVVFRGRAHQAAESTDIQ